MTTYRAKSLKDLEETMENHRKSSIVMKKEALNHRRYPEFLLEVAYGLAAVVAYMAYIQGVKLVK